MRAKRVRALKKIIIISIIAGILISTALCILLLFKVHGLEQQIQELYTIRESERKEEVLAVDVETRLPVNIAAKAQETAVLEEEEKPLQEQTEVEVEAEESRKVHLTFDDGPSVYTDEILDILAENQVKATFFVTGKEDEHSKEMYRRIVREGHTLGMHSYSHKYKEIYASKESFISDLEKLQSYLYEVTGEKPTIYRFPGGSSNQVSSMPMRELIQVLNDRQIQYHDWNISSGDATNTYISTDKIVANCTQALQGFHEATILMHDAADKRTTVEALPVVINKILEMENTEIIPITEESVPIQHIKD